MKYLTRMKLHFIKSFPRTFPESRSFPEFKRKPYLSLHFARFNEYCETYEVLKSYNL